MIISKILLTPFVLLVAAIWLFVGLAFYIPLIAKAVTLFTMQLLLAAITQRSATVGDGLQRALRFYPNGFAIIFGALNFDGKTAPGEEYTRGFFGPLIDAVRAIFLALVFWATSILFFHHVGVWRIDVVDRLEQKLFAYLGFGARATEPVFEPTSRAGPRATVRRTSNLRSGPGTHHGQVGVLTPGIDLLILDDPDVADDWALVQTPEGTQGYVARSLLVPAESDLR